MPSQLGWLIDLYCIHTAGLSQGLALVMLSHREPFYESQFKFGTEPGMGQAPHCSSQLVSLKTTVI